MAPLIGRADQKGGDRIGRLWRGVETMLAAAIIVFVMAVPCRAQESEILAVLEAWSEIYANSSDSAEMKALYHPDAVFFGTGGLEPMLGLEAFGPYFQNQFDNFSDRDHAFIDPVIRFYGAGQIATATGLYRFIVTPTNGEDPIDVTYRYTLSLVSTDEGWLIIQHHSSQLP